MRTLLEVKHRSKDGLVLPDSYRGWSRSFTKHFIEGLYLSHANILTGVPYTVSDVMGSTNRSVDGDGVGPTNTGNAKANMQVLGPGGYNAVPLFMGDKYSGVANGFAAFTWVPGHVFGIMIGRSNTAVTPTDVMLNDRIHHGTHGSIGVLTNIESYLPTDLVTETYTNTNGYIGMVIMPKRSCSMTDIQFKCFRTGNPGNVTAVLIAIDTRSGGPLVIDSAVIATSNIVNANAWPSTSGTASMQTFTFASPPYLQAGFTYFIGITPAQASGGNYVNLRGVTIGTQPNSSAWAATALNTNMSQQSMQLNYQIDGTAGAEMEYGSTELMGASYVVSNPTAVFTLRRFFWNNSGEAITVQESGIYFPLTRYIAIVGSYDMNNFIVCAAHDTFAGIVVNNGESIEVDYTPSIHV
jgi:hypothetical protein